MIPVKTQQRFKCDFCKYRSIRSVVEKHEKRCFRNPNRFCDTCQNTGKTHQMVQVSEFGVDRQEIDCPYCSKFNPTLKAEIEAREEKEKPPIPLVPLENLPF